MGNRSLVWGAWCGPVALILYSIAFLLVARWVPPTDPMLSASAIAGLYDNHRNMIRVGQSLCLMFSVLLLPWFAVISLQLARIEGRMPFLAMCQFGGGVITVTEFIVVQVLWLVAAYRADYQPESIRILHDMGWLFFELAYANYSLQLICVAAVAFMDKRPHPFVPRWMAYYCLWMAVTVAAGAMAAFFKTGPFAYNGLFSFYLPVAFFFIWVCIMTRLLLKALDEDEKDSGALPVLSAG